MKKLLYKILLLVIIIFVLNRITYEVVDAPFYWQNDVASEKEMIVNKNKSEFNTIFIGSSRTYRQIDPHLFDSFTASYNLKSFNYGIQNLFAPYTHLIAEDLLENDSLHFDYLFIELTKSLHATNSKLPQVLVWEDINQEIAISNTLMRDKDHSLLFKLGKLKVHIFNAVNKASNANLLDFHFNRSNYINELVPQSGFLSLDAENEIRPTVKLRNDHFLSDTMMIERFNKESDAVFSSLANFKDVNEVYYKELVSLIEKAKEKDVQLFYYLPTRFVDYEAEEIVAIFNKLPESNKLQPAYSNDFKKLYLTENNWDRGHLNKKGAAIYTKLLAEAFLRHQQEKLADN